MPVVSYIVIAHNEEKNISAALRTLSVLGLKHDIEVILVDDASVDRTSEIAQGFRANCDFLKIVKNTSNVGRAGSRNRGLECATGKYVFFLDADDYLAPGYFPGLEDYLNDSLDIVVCNRIDVDQDNGHVFPAHHALKMNLPYFKANTILDCPQSVYDNFINGKFYKLSFLTNNGISFPEDRRNAEDIWFSMAAWLSAKTIGFCRQPFYVYTRGNYKKNFSEEKCGDAFINLSRLRTLIEGKKNRNIRLLVARKYVAGVIETCQRAKGIIDLDSLSGLLAKHFDVECLLGLNISEDFLPEHINILQSLVENLYRDAIVRAWR